MLIARVDIERLGIKVPRDVMKMSRYQNPESSLRDIPSVAYDADCWIGCVSCWPHNDAKGDFDDMYFLTLSVHGDRRHLVADDQMDPDKEILLSPGEIFVVDPRRRHWLAPLHWESPRFPWVGLQWELPRDEAPQRTREILKRLGAWWLKDADPRYAPWALS